MLKDISRSNIENLIFKMTKLSSYTKEPVDDSVKTALYNDVRNDIVKISKAILQFRTHLATDSPTDENDPNYDMVKIFKDIIFPTYKRKYVINYYYAPDLPPGKYDLIKKDLQSKFTKSINFSIKYDEENNYVLGISLDYFWRYFRNKENNDPMILIDYPHGEEELEIFRDHLQRIFPNGDMYIYSLPKRDSYLDIRNVHENYLCFKDIQSRKDKINLEFKLTSDEFLIEQLIKLIKEVRVEDVTTEFTLPL